MARYAETTTVPVSRSQAEIQSLIRRYGARKFVSGFDEDVRIAAIQFEMHGRRIAFRLRLPDSNDDQFRYDGRGRERSTSAWENAYQQECRRLWRSLLLVIKAKLESVESGVETFEEAFLPQIVLPGTDGQTVGEFAVPQLEIAYQRGTLPAMLPGVTERDVLALGSGNR
jgi:hypothetical protein